MYIWATLFGVIIGSFLNVCIFRIPHKQSIIFPPSHCMECNHRLNILDLVPIISFLILRGRCRYCGEKINVQYPLIEGINGIVYSFLFLKFSISYQFVFYSMFFSLLLVLAAIDFKIGIIPNTLIVLESLLGIMYRMMESFMNHSFMPIEKGILGFLSGEVIILIVIVISCGGMGVGDMKLMGVIGLLLGVGGVVVTLFLGVFIGGMIAVILLMTKIKNRKDTIPFGPFLAVGTFVFLYWGEMLINWYLSLL